LGSLESLDRLPVAFREEQGVSEVVVPEYEVWIELDRSTEELFRFAKTSLVAVGDSQIRVERGVLGIELDRAMEGGRRALEILELSQSGAEVPPRGGVLGKKLYGLSKLRDGALDVVGLDERLSELIPRRRELRVELYRALQRFDRVTPLESVRPEDVPKRALRSSSNRALQILPRRGGLASGMRRISKRLARPRWARMLFARRPSSDSIAVATKVRGAPSEASRASLGRR
jgi:hypothetical protein